MLKFINKNDFSPFYGGGLGIHMIDWTDPQYNGIDEYTPNYQQNGLALNLQSGLVLFRTYDINLHLRGKYELMFNENKTQSITLNAILVFKGNTENTTRIIHQRSMLEIMLDLFFNKD